MGEADVGKGAGRRPLSWGQESSVAWQQLGQENSRPLLSPPAPVGPSSPRAASASSCLPQPSSSQSPSPARGLETQAPGPLPHQTQLQVPTPQAQGPGPCMVLRQLSWPAPTPSQLASRREAWHSNGGGGVHTCSGLPWDHTTQVQLALGGHNGLPVLQMVGNEVADALEQHVLRPHLQGQRPGHQCSGPAPGHVPLGDNLQPSQSHWLKRLEDFNHRTSLRATEPQKDVVSETSRTWGLHFPQDAEDWPHRGTYRS